MSIMRLAILSGPYSSVETSQSNIKKWETHFLPLEAIRSRWQCQLSSWFLVAWCMPWPTRKHSLACFFLKFSRNHCVSSFFFLFLVILLIFFLKMKTAKWRWMFCEKSTHLLSIPSKFLELIGDFHFQGWAYWWLPVTGKVSVCFSSPNLTMKNFKLKHTVFSQTHRSDAIQG
jgi:hypothetical protein